MIDTTRILLGRELSVEEYSATATLGWCIELFQAFMLVTDDIMDASETRRGHVCWYLRPEVGLIAINDACMLESAIYILLKKHLRNHPAYIDMVELFHEVSFKTELGQSCDLLVEGESLENYNMEKYEFIVRFKTAFYSFYLPVVLALMYTGKASARNLEATKSITVAMGEYFQVQDDYLDNFADPQVLGKIGTDIQDKKCSWLVVQALKRCSPDQRKLLHENYGRKNKDCEREVKLLYDELGLEAVYREYEDCKVNEIRNMISAVDEGDGLNRLVFEAFLNKIHKRTK